MTNQNQNQNRNETERRILPEGKYRVRAIDASFGEAGTGTEQVGVLLEVTEGEHKGAMLTWYGYFTPDTEERSIQSLRYLGWKGVDIMELSTMYSGQEAQADVKHDTDRDGKTRAKVEWINGIGVVMKKKFEGAELASFAKRMRGLASRVGGAAAQANGGSNLPPVGRREEQRADGNGRGNDAPPPNDRDAPPWGQTRGGGGGQQQGGGYRR